MIDFTEFNIWVTACLALLFIGQIIFSIHEKTFLYRQEWHVDLPLVWHWGVLLGGPILILFAGLEYNYIHFGWHSIILAVLNFAITYVLHWFWRSIDGHISPGTKQEKVGMDDKPWQTSWLKNLDVAGWFHVIFFFCALQIVLEFIIAPLPPTALKKAIWLLMIFAPFAVFEPPLAEWCRKIIHDPEAKWLRNATLQLLAMWAGILICYYCKLKALPTSILT